MSTFNQPSEPQRKPARVWSMIAWGVVVLGVFMALGFLAAEGTAAKIGGLLITFAWVLPAAWLLFRRFQDRKAQEEYVAAVESEHQLQQILGNENSGFTQPMAALDPPERKPRRWGVVATTAVAALVVGGLISPTPESPEVQPAAEETVSATPTPDNRAEEERKAKAERAAKESQARESEKREAEASEKRAAEESEKREAEASEKRAAEESEKREAEESEKREAERLEAEEAAREQARKDDEAREREAQAERDRIAQEQAAAAEQERIRNEQQQIQQFAPAAPAVTTSYKNCTDVWNRLGRPIYAGEPGYTSGPRKLDGNSDGVGCESDPR